MSYLKTLVTFAAAAAGLLMASSCGSSAGGGGGGFLPAGDASLDSALIGVDSAAQTDASAVDAADVASCQPVCANKECGDDGCGGTCGKCPSAAPTCGGAGKCVATCAPACANKECGDDGCGGSCGTCPSAAPVCDTGTSKCTAAACQPTCAADFCGDDGCGAKCTCGNGKVCGSGSACVEPVTLVPAFGSVSVNLIDIDKFPTYLAHLYGTDLADVGQFDFLSVEVKNPDAVSHSVTIDAQMQGYSAKLTTVVTLAPLQSKKLPINLTFDFKNALYPLTAPVQANVSITLSESGNTLDSFDKQVTILPVTTVELGSVALNGKTVAALPLTVTLATPAATQNLVADAAQHSKFGSMVGYQYIGESNYALGTYTFGTNAPALTATVTENTYTTWETWYEAGDQVSFSVAVSGGFSDNCSYFVLDTANFTKWKADGSGTALYSTSVLGSATGKITIATAGFYHHVALNPSTNFSDRVFTITRAVAANEGAADQIGALFLALQKTSKGYSSVSAGFFAGTQTIKYPAKTLADGSGNCIDGTLVFAAALESMGMEPLIESPDGHAFVAVRCFPGSKCIVPIETTMVATSTPGDAIATAAGEMAGVQQEVDVNAMVGKGYLPVGL